MKFQSDRLAYPGRYLRTHSGKLLFGPAGDRLFVDYLDKEPGFAGRIDFIHKTNLTEIFTIRTEPEVDFIEADTTWYPDRLHMELNNHILGFWEEKFITQDDIAVSCQHWTNNTENDIKLYLNCAPQLCEVSMEEEDIFLVKTPKTIHGYRIGFCVMSDLLSPKGAVVLHPRESIEFTAAAAFGNLETENFEDLIQKLRNYYLKDEGTQGRCRTQKEEYAGFFRNAPEFTCSDELLNKAWLYRWYLLKNTYAKPGYGNFRHPVMYEGRSHKMGKNPFKSEGWEFSKLIPLTTPLHLMELQWNNDEKIWKELVLSLLDSQDENGLFRVMTVDEFGTPYANFVIWAIYRNYLIRGDREFVRQILPDLKRYIRGHQRLYSGENDDLQIERIHQRTGKEYQPSYWYFHGYPKDYLDPDTYTPLKRVDRSIYHYLNLLGISGLCAAVGDETAGCYKQMAQILKRQINDKMWDENTGFYYDLHYKTDEKALVKNIVGFYPYWAGITSKDRLKAMELLLDPGEFNTESPFPSVSKSCPAYSAAGGWMGNYMKGRDGCVWCGPSWPYTNGIIVDMLGIQSKKNDHKYDRMFRNCLRAYALQHFRNQDLNSPYLVEHYNPDTGELLSDEVDYNHSYFIHLIMSHVAGIEIQADRVVINPLDIGLQYFECRQVAVRGHILDMEYNRKQGIKVYWDKKLIASGEELKIIEIQLNN